MYSVQKYGDNRLENDLAHQDKLSVSLYMILSCRTGHHPTRGIYYVLLALCCILHATVLPAQKLYYYDEFNGGVTAGGYGPNYDGSGTGQIKLHIPANATIRKATLFAGDHHSATSLTVTLNNIPFVFSTSTAVISGFHSNYGSPASIHAIDIQAAINPANQIQTLVVPPQSGPGGRFADFYVVVEYQFPGSFRTRISMFLDTIDFQPEEIYSALPISRHTSGNNDLGLAMYTGYLCGDTFDGEFVTCNGNALGQIFGPEKNSGLCAGPFANFYYENGALNGLGDDDPDLKMNGDDVLANIRSLVKPGDQSIDLRFDHTQGNSPSDNSIWGVIIVDGDTNCTNFSIQLKPPQLQAKAGDSVDIELVSSSDFSGVRTIDLDLNVNTDLLGFLSAFGNNTITLSAGHLHITGNPFITLTNKVLATLRFKVYLSKAPSTDITLSNLVLNSGDMSIIPCHSGGLTGSATALGGAVFTLKYLCGDSTLQHFLNGVLPLSVNSLRPNPVTDEFTLEMYSAIEDHIQLRISNSLGIILEQNEFDVRAGDQTHIVNAAHLPAGAYHIELQSSGGSWTSHFIKINE
jgi:hypothetical protein